MLPVRLGSVLPVRLGSVLPVRLGSVLPVRLGSVLPVRLGSGVAGSPLVLPVRLGSVLPPRLGSVSSPLLPVRLGSVLPVRLGSVLPVRLGSEETGTLAIRIAVGLTTRRHHLGQRASDEGEEHVVDRTAVPRLGRKHGLQVEGVCRHGPSGGDRAVERRDRRVQDGPRRKLGPGTRELGEHPATPRHGPPHAPDDRRQPLQVTPQVHRSVGQQLASGRRWVDPQRHTAVARFRHQSRQQGVRCHAVGNAVVQLHEHRHAVVAAALEEPDLPEGLATIERPTGQAAHERVHRRAVTRSGNLGPTDVVVEVQLRDRDPDRVVQITGHVHHPPRERRPPRHELADHLLGRLEGQWVRRGIEHRELQGVHVTGGGLVVQEARVQTTQARGPMVGFKAPFSAPRVAPVTAHSPILCSPSAPTIDSDDSFCVIHAATGG
ncbi:MAG: hypothetical protein M5U19_11915 [Microthrixaceae bacterium]|nr:hypothetical protein [Microthrixaceae bacterium]